MSPADADAPRRDSIGEWLKNPPCWFGQILIERDTAGRFLLRHRDDAIQTDLECHSKAEVAGELVRFDDAGRYRPLKTAPNLRRGWMLSLASTQEVVVALDFFYPGRLVAFLAWRNGSLRPTPFRETLARQTGMYRVAAKISDAQADLLIGNFCRSDGGCLRTIFWRRDGNGTVASNLLPATKFDPEHDQTGDGQAALPLICQEACNLLVAEARMMVKAAA